MSGMSKANQRQHIRRKPGFDAYKKGERREWNKAVRLVKHMARAPEDTSALSAFERLPPHIRRKFEGRAAA